MSYVQNLRIWRRGERGALSRGEHGFVYDIRPRDDGRVSLWLRSTFQTFLDPSYRGMELGTYPDEQAAMEAGNELIHQHRIDRMRDQCDRLE